MCLQSYIKIGLENSSMIFLRDPCLESAKSIMNHCFIVSKWIIAKNNLLSQSVCVSILGSNFFISLIVLHFCNCNLCSLFGLAFGMVQWHIFYLFLPISSFICLYLAADFMLLGLLKFLWWPWQISVCDNHNSHCVIAAIGHWTVTAFSKALHR